jgi:PAS domain S-box-containing protein
LPPKFSKSPNDPDVLSGSDNAPALHPRTPVDLLLLHPEILDQLHDSIIITDMQGTITGCNQAVTHMYGYTQQELIGQSVDIFYPPEDLDTVRASVFRTLVEKGHVTTELRNKTKSGAEIFIHLTITMLRDANSNPVGLAGLSQDITERKLTELALRHSDQKLRGLAQVCPDFFFTTRADGWTDWVSPKFYEHTGAPQGGGDGLTWADYLHPDDREKTATKWTAAVKRGDPFETEHRFRGRDGVYRWFRSRATPTRNANGKVERWIGIGSDIHDQKQAEAALRESERKFKDLAEAIPHSVWITSAEGFAEYSNQRWLELTGLSMEESLGHGWLSAIHPDDAAQTMARWEEAAALGKTFEAEYRIKTADGTYRWQLARGVRHKSGDGQGDKWFGTCTDIHDHKMAMKAVREREDALRQQQLVLATLIESTTDYVYMKDRAGRYVFLNSSAANSMGKAVQEIVGKDDTFLFPADSARQIMKKDDELMAAGKSAVYEETHPIGDSTQHLFTSKSICRDASSAVIGIVGISRDVTEHKEAENALISRDLNEAAARMAHALAHEINNPLAAITNAIYLLQQGTEILPSKELLNAAEHSLSRITKITRHMIGLYNRNARPHKINVQEIVEDTLASVESQVIARSIQIEKTLKQCEFNGIDTDLRQLISALMENAIEQGRSLIKLRLSPTKGPRAGFRLAIADNGPGIAPQHRHQLFEPFFSTKTEPASGLGLWVTRSIAEKYEGYIRLRTSTREGASGTCVMVVMFSRRPRRRAGEQVA